jgi:hypothetical protein
MMILLSINSGTIRANTLCDKSSPYDYRPLITSVLSSSSNAKYPIYILLLQRKPLISPIVIHPQRIIPLPKHLTSKEVVDFLGLSAGRGPVMHVDISKNLLSPENT